MNSNRSIRSNTNLSGRNSPIFPSKRSDYGNSGGSPPLDVSHNRSRNDERSPSTSIRSSVNRAKDEDRLPSPIQSPRSSRQRINDDRKTSSSPPLRASGFGAKDGDKTGSPQRNSRSTSQVQAENNRKQSPTFGGTQRASQRLSGHKTTEEERPGSPQMTQPIDSGRLGSSSRPSQSNSLLQSERNRKQSPTFGGTQRASHRLSGLKTTEEERPGSPRVDQPLHSGGLGSNSRSSQSNSLLQSERNRNQSPTFGGTPTASQRLSGRKATEVKRPESPQMTQPIDSSRFSSNSRSFGSSKLEHSRTLDPNGKDYSISKSPKTFTPKDISFHRTAFERCLSSPDQKFIRNREKFNLALSYVGYDLPKVRVDEIWNQHDQEITVADFQRILQDEKPIDERTLEEAFATLYNDSKGNGKTVDYDRFRRDVTEKGDRFTNAEFEGIRRLLGTADGKIDIKQLTRKIIDNRRDCREEILIENKTQRLDDESQRLEEMTMPKRSQRDVKGKTINVTIEPKPKRIHIAIDGRRVVMKGAFFCEHFDSAGPQKKTFYYSLGYTFQLKRETPISIVLEPKISGAYHKDKSFEQIDVRLLLFEILPNGKRKLIDISKSRLNNKSFIQIDELARGSYEVLPLTFGGVLQPRSRMMNDRPPTKQLREKRRGGPTSMTSDYRKALEFIFDLFDLDGNEQLDRNEYNLLTKRMSSEEITDDDWASIQENFHLDREQNISKSKYLEMNEFEVKNDETKDEELWTGLKAIGFNGALELDMMCPFELTFHGNQTEFRVEPTAFVELSEVKKPLLKFLAEKSERLKIGIPSVQCIHYEDNCGSILYVENKSDKNLSFQIQATNVKNSALTLPIHGRKPPVIHVPNKSDEIIWFAHPLDYGQPMELEASIQPAD